MIILMVPRVFQPLSFFGFIIFRITLLCSRCRELKGDLATGSGAATGTTRFAIAGLSAE
jgi:hypothetical protein